MYAVVCETYGERGVYLTVTDTKEKAVEKCIKTIKEMSPENEWEIAIEAVVDSEGYRSEESEYDIYYMEIEKDKEYEI